MKRYGPFSVKATSRIVGQDSMEGPSQYDLVIFKCGRLHLEVSSHGLCGMRLLVLFRAGGRYRILVNSYGWYRPANRREKLVNWAWGVAEGIGFPERSVNFEDYSADSNIYGGR